MKEERNHFRLAAVAAALCFATAPALAQNKGGGGGSTSSAGGVITIDQARAEAGGVTPGDAPGFPVTISQPGSYRLMSNLTVSDPALTAIDVIANDVTIDLNGFVIQGPVSCSGGSPAAITCTPYSTGTGVRIPNAEFVAVRNGAIKGFAYGVLGGYHGQFEGLRVGHTAFTAIGGGLGTQISNNVVFQSGGSGISANQGDVRSNSIFWVRLHGISAGYGSLIVGNRVSLVGQYGIDAVYFGNAALAHNSVASATLGAINGGVKMDGNACNGQVCP